MNANQAEATKHQGKPIIYSLPTAGLTQNGVYGEIFLAFIYNFTKRQTQTYGHYSGIKFTFSVYTRLRDEPQQLTCANAVLASQWKSVSNHKDIACTCWVDFIGYTLCSQAVFAELWNCQCQKPPVLSVHGFSPLPTAVSYYSQSRFPLPLL